VALAALWGLGALPVDRINTEVASMRTRVSRVVQFLGPVASPTANVAQHATPQAVAALNKTSEPAESVPTEAAPPDEPEVKAAALPTIEKPTSEATSVGASPTVEATSSPTFAPTATPSPTATATATLTPTATATPAPTATQAQPPTPSGRVTYIVRSGDTLSTIATKYKIAWQDLANANGLTSRTPLQVGQELVIPVPGGSAAPAATAPAPAASSGAPIKYKVQSGDSLSSIASKFGITWQELAAANGLTAKSRLNVGQVLTVPGANAVSQAAPTAPPAPTATTRAPSPGSTALLPAPELVNPADQASYGGGRTEIYLIWQQRDGIPSGAGYRVAIQWTQNGEPMEYLVPVTTATSIRMPAWLFERADQPARKYTWSVRVVQSTTDGQGREKDVLLSPSSETRALYWY
jgi:LysM repeat protein